eukprot:gb/GEZN01001079.1/.p1 GENE.gb/GEZN01001079.1/~~gb/GEZN01001079.1/.p1  ORF type:complete len:1074 (+),score=139.42 gb/GEZN01001079.1/:62-3283(+)
MNIIKGQGLPDFCMLDKDRINEDEFLKNLKMRFEQKQIYTYIGEQLVAMNPFTAMPELYNDETLRSYRNRYMYEVQPHIFALAEDTYRALRQSKRDQCVIVTGESGAGKTEATKIFMQYISAVTIGDRDGKAQKTNKKLLDSNPVLEAFGNAKTLRNDNSSRFGKYMEIQFSAIGMPLGGRISQYLLEKSRVVTRAKDERSFHIFYMFLTKSAGELKKYSVSSDPSKYEYLKCSGCYKVPSIKDGQELATAESAMRNLGFQDNDFDSVWRILAGILNLGNINYKLGKDPKVKTDFAEVISESDCETVAALLQVKSQSLRLATTQRTITTGPGRKSSVTNVYLNVEQAEDTRNSLAKALYNSLFDLVVGMLNVAIKHAEHDLPEVVIGILDIYGFEIFEDNSFEQFCINYCNEKLQQLFIHLVLQTEQEEYVNEGIPWTQIDYFNNAPVVNLIEAKMGIIKLLDEAGQVGAATSASVLEKFDKHLKTNPHYTSYEASGHNKEFKLGTFRIRHYAGDVDYNAELFLPKNRDTLFNDLKQLCQSSQDPFIKAFFPQEEQSRKKPETAATQFKGSLNNLILKLRSCVPHYIRCVKSNDVKQAFNWNAERIKHQSRYLNLTETVRVRRAGFCNRQGYARFLQRYKCISAKTWPVWKGDGKAGVKALLEDNKFSPSEYALGKTQIFVKDSTTLTRLEQLYHQNLPKVVLSMQKYVRMFCKRQDFLRYGAHLVIQRAFRAYTARQLVQDYKFIRTQAKVESAAVIQALYRDFAKDRDTSRMLKQLKRTSAVLRIQAEYRWHVRMNWLNKLAHAVRQGNDQKLNFAKHVQVRPLSGLDEKANISLVYLLQRIQVCFWASRWIGQLSVGNDRILMRQKVDAMDVFRGKKPWDPTRAFIADYAAQMANVEIYQSQIQNLYSAGGDSVINFSTDTIKVNRKGQSQHQAIIISDKHIYKYWPGKWKMIKEGIPLSAIKEICMSPNSDSYVVIKMSEAPWRDMVLDLGVNGYETYSELVAVLLNICDQQIAVTFNNSITFDNARTATGQGKVRTLTFQSAGLTKSPKLPSGCQCKFLGANGAVVNY